ncbi:unnamed protein product [Danaus chrysippus]|uniref:(African queen) hypothetical protein n=1 Tax=Danaus chrysippus TaxID=151541 RepID=A0A8J2M6K5_9NEOP|nr:unnamed protein product [Danaus chrysippus]
MKSCYNEVASSWLRSNPGSVIKQANVAELLGTAYPRSVRMDIAQNGFKATGLWPCDRNVIKAEDFVASVYISDPSNQEPNGSPEPTTESSARATSPSIITQPIVASPSVLVVSPPPSTSLPSPPKIITPPLIPKDSTLPTVQPEPSKIDKISNNEEIKSHLNVLSPVPCINTVIKKMKKGTKRTMELTSSPYKNEMEAKENMNKKKKPILDMKKLKTEKKINKNIQRRSSDETYRKNKKMKTKKSWLCQLCKEDREEDMIQCSKCKGWIHDLCAGVESKIKKYTCDICVQSQ